MIKFDLIIGTTVGLNQFLPKTSNIFYLYLIL